MIGDLVSEVAGIVDAFRTRETDREMARIG